MFKVILGYRESSGPLRKQETLFHKNKSQRHKPETRRGGGSHMRLKSFRPQGILLLQPPE